MSGIYIPKALREAVAAQAKHRCGYCLTPEICIGVAMEIEHLLPRSKGGQTVEGNLWLACSPCNDAKLDRVVVVDPESQELVPFFNPRNDHWSVHLDWVEGGTQIKGTTAIGRATVHALRLNSELRIKARRIWIAAGWAPPKD